MTIGQQVGGKRRVAVLRSAVDPSGSGKQYDLAAPHIGGFTFTQSVIPPGADGVKVARAAVASSPDLIHSLGPAAFVAVRKVALERARPGAAFPKWLASGASTVEPRFNAVPHLTATLSEYDHERDWAARLLPAPMQFGFRPGVECGPLSPRAVAGTALGESGPHILAAGGFDDAANLTLAAWAFDILKYPHPNLQLVFLGDGPKREEVLAFAHALAPDDFRVSAPGHVADVRPYLTQAALVFGTHARGGTKFLLEAMATGVPVIAADTPDARSVVSHGETGLLVPPGRAVRMAEEAHRLLNSPDRARTLVVAAEGVAVGYSVPDLARAWAGAYHSLTSSDSPRSG